MIGFLLCFSCTNPKQNPEALKPSGPDETALSTGKTLLKEFKLSDQELKMIDIADKKNTKSFNCQTMCCKPVAFSVSGNNHVSSGMDVILEYNKVITDEGPVWAVGAPIFIVPCNGLYCFSIDFVKDAYYNNGTTDDVSINLIKVPFIPPYVGTCIGYAWSGEGAGMRGTGAYDVVLKLKQGDKIYTTVHSDGGRNRHLMYYNFSGFSIGGTF